MTDAFVLGGVRTPVGRYGGSLSHIRVDDLVGRTMVAACQRVGLPLHRVDDIVAGCARDAVGDAGRVSWLICVGARLEHAGALRPCQP